ncbi:hypothetical protein LTR96_011530 [Exophiala xenobiotica]|nr:hypothetical protein LTR41_011712 [Exophiala xenobiotica]KAK5215187.1 hypothetical protein LTR72_011740 [Exophiala xenobiotica]KAK5217849.1 hypothetical protein LTR47_011808 [Exophiala xenobiotica]KAK5242810.1 hypothetical protein LTS06_011271 [Exophiala xenobiotica]KAK5263031.1 hypothetical protein LTR96_011530 [Exophiala xenobiotica]
MDHAVVPESSMVKVPPDTQLRLLAPLGCGLQTGAGCVINTLRVARGSTVAIFGVGPVGMAGVMAAKIMSCSTIIAIDLREDRLAIAKEVGATHTLNGQALDLTTQIQDICSPAGLKFAMDCTGVPKVIDTMIQSLGRRGKAATVGAPKPGSKAVIDVFDHLIMGKEYVGCTEGDADPKTFIPFLIKQHAMGNFPIEKIIKFYPISKFSQAFQDMKNTNVIKPVLVWE